MYKYAICKIFVFILYFQIIDPLRTFLYHLYAC